MRKIFSLFLEVNKFDYNKQGQSAQHDKCSIGINSNSLMRFDVNTGQLITRKSFLTDQKFTAMATDEKGNIITGDKEGRIKIFSDLEKKAARSTTGLVVNIY